MATSQDNLKKLYLLTSQWLKTFKDNQAELGGVKNAKAQELSAIRTYTKTVIQKQAKDTAIQREQGPGATVDAADKAQEVGSTMVDKDYYKVNHAYLIPIVNPFNEKEKLINPQTGKPYVKGEPIAAEHVKLYSDKFGMGSITWCNQFAMDLTNDVLGDNSPFKDVNPWAFSASKLHSYMQENEGKDFEKIGTLEKAWEEINKGKIVYFTTSDHIATGVPTKPEDMRTSSDGKHKYGKIVQAGASVGEMYLSQAWSAKSFPKIKIHSVANTGNEEGTDNGPQDNNNTTPSNNTQPTTELTPQTDLYVVQSGESLEKLAAKFSVSEADLIAANQDKIKTWGSVQGFNAGEQIIIPKKGTAPDTTPSDEKSTYEVVKDAVVDGVETLYETGKDLYEGGKEALKDGLDFVSGLWGGNDDDKPEDKEEKVENTPVDNSPQTELYIVQSGESLPKLAAKFSVTEEDLKAANKDKLQRWGTVEGFNAGEQIVIPKKGTAPNTDNTTPQDNTTDVPVHNGGGTIPKWIPVAKNEINTTAKNEAGLKRIMQYTEEVNYYNWVDTGPVSRANNKIYDWCGIFVTWCLQQVGVATLGEKGAAAKKWKDYGTKIDKPVYGAIAVTPSNGHVAFVVDVDKNSGVVTLLGGNQGTSDQYTSLCNIQKFSGHYKDYHFCVPSSFDLTKAKYLI
ncbi:MAG: LysM peptidoglycan-binding domain-containing protein [Aureispira sp.]|nr:LysM peptidoglycan-binding domain-containing protein [Aureispira sp.]